MKVLVATPLYPPDIAAPAPYIKELATRMAQTHTVTIVAYGHIPEEIPGVRIVVVNKRAPIFARLLRFFWVLFIEARSADCIFAENGRSVELPLVFAATLTRTPYILHLGDPTAEARSVRGLSGFIDRTARRYARTVLKDLPLTRPEILPLDPRPESELQAYTASWDTHLAVVNAVLTHDAS